MRRLLSTILVVIVLAAAAALASGCGADDPGITTYSDPKYGYSFDYPGDWKLVTGDGAGVQIGADAASTITIGDPKGARVGETGIDLVMIRVYELTQTVDASMMPEILPYIEALLADLGSQDTSWKTESSLTETTVGGAPAFETTASFELESGRPVKTTSYFVFAGDVEYQIVVQASAENWEEDQAVFDAIVASFSPRGNAD